MDKNRQRGLLRYSLASRLGAQQATSHAGSKPGILHKGTSRRASAWTVVCSTHRDSPDPGCKACRGVQQQQRGRSAAPPPSARAHRRLEPVPALSSGERLDRYAARGYLTPAQRRRCFHKLRHAQARGARQAPPPPAPASQPAPPAKVSWSRRALRAIARLKP